MSVAALIFASSDDAVIELYNSLNERKYLAS